ncbi:uncharacterized protein LOC143027678 [Oratosquilla oratoria]|uniref:uncharacterized protein LOC143027678 n=1 Tax=Oratosquilla oratoria TaxID=337810 RepID=UPI003F76359D
MYLEENPFFAYVFTVLNASQGVLIFALNCLANDEVRAAVMDKLCQVKRTLTKRSTVLSGSATTAACQQPYHNHHHVHHHARHKRPPHHSATAVARQPFGGSPGGYASRRSDRIQEEHPWRSTLAATPDILQSRCLGSSFDLPSARSRSSAGPLGGRRRREGEGFEPGIRNTAIAGLDSRCQCQAAASTLSVSGSPLSHRKTRNASAWSADTQLSVLSDSSSAEGIGQGNFSRRISSSSSSSFGSSSIDSTSSSYSPGPPPPRPSAPHFHDAFHYATPSLWQVDLRLEGEVEDKSNSSFESHRFIPGFESIPEREERRE